ncbi:hypothetical protein LIER_13657 [Lithospermum erythrorhizon]|uniref:Uncharacterized protein n=1 Tax=Lithospermum erythrorhizon TaxID=34254 RepID=A0AAV3PW80_LITER
MNFGGYRKLYGYSVLGCIPKVEDEPSTDPCSGHAAMGFTGDVASVVIVRGCGLLNSSKDEGRNMIWNGGDLGQQEEGSWMLVSLHQAHQGLDKGRVIIEEAGGAMGPEGVYLTDS